MHWTCIFYSAPPRELTRGFARAYSYINHFVHDLNMSNRTRPSLNKRRSYSPQHRGDGKGLKRISSDSKLPKLKRVGTMPNRRGVKESKLSMKRDMLLKKQQGGQSGRNKHGKYTVKKNTKYTEKDKSAKDVRMKKKKPNASP